jgi:hypothetical protein
MKTYIVAYTLESLIGNQCLEMEITAPGLEVAYEQVNLNFPEIMIDQIYPA